MTDGAIDGRRARSERSRTAIVDAFLGLIESGSPRPTVEEVAAEAGVSERSVFRHFADVDSLIEAAIARRTAAIAPLALVDASPSDPVDVRIERLVASRCRLFEETDAMRRITETARATNHRVDEVLRAASVMLRDQLSVLFAEELRRAPSGADTLDALAAVTSWGIWHTLRSEYGVPVARTKRVMRELVANNLLQYQ